MIGDMLQTKDAKLHHHGLMHRVLRKAGARPLRVRTTGFQDLLLYTLLDNLHTGCQYLMAVDDVHRQL